MSQQKTKKIQENSIPELPPIPDKLYFSIGEVGQLCDLKAHVLRYWEQEFPQLAPAKRRGNRRYYQRHDVMMIRKIRNLLYFQGYTLEGARHQLIKDTAPSSTASHENVRILLKSTLSSLEELLEELKS